MKMHCTKGNVIVKVDLELKNSYMLSPNNKIILRRDVGEENLNRRLSQPVQGIVIDAEKIPKNCVVLIHHNATHASYEIMDVPNEPHTKIFSIPVGLIFCHSTDLFNWTACENFLITLRIFKPYKGALSGVTSSLIPHRLYIVSGLSEDGEDLSGKVCIVTKNSDYQIVYQGNNGREAYVLRTRSREILAIDPKTLHEAQTGGYLLGYSYKDAQTLEGIKNKQIEGITLKQCMWMASENIWFKLTDSCLQVETTNCTETQRDKLIEFETEKGKILFPQNN